MNLEVSSNCDGSSADDAPDADVERSVSVAISVGSDRTGLELDFDELLERIGSYGRFQKLLIVMLVIPSAAACGLVYVSQYFILLVPDHHCAIPAARAAQVNRELEHVLHPDAAQDAIDLWIPRADNKFSSCRMFDAPNYFRGGEAPTSKCSNWTYDFNASNLYPTIATELNWVCDDARLPYDAQTIFYVGTSVGCVFFGYISDRFGRKPSIIISFSIAAVAGLLTPQATSFCTFCILRFFVGSTLLAFSEDPYVLSLEFIGVQKRTLSIISWVFGYIIFSALAPWLALRAKNWRTLCYVTSAPLLLFVFGAYFIPESASWLMTQGRRREAFQILKRVAAVNGRKVPSTLIDPVSDTHRLVSPHCHSRGASASGGVRRKDSMAMRTAKKISALHIFVTPRLRSRTLVLGVVWFTTLCCYHANIQNTSNLGADVYQSFTFGALVELPSIVIVAFGLDRVGRRLPMIVSTHAAGLLGVSTPLLDARHYLLVGLMMRVCLATQYNVIIQYSAEVYPTVLRGRAIAFLRLMGTFGLLFSPSIAFLAIATPHAPFLITGVLLLGVSALSLLLPETMGQQLPHTEEQGENFGRGQPIFKFFF